MVSITNQRDARKARDLNFCYLCGEAFNPEDKTNYDHAPPETIFLEQDRNFPIKLKTHETPCHSSMNLDDEAMGQLISYFHRKPPSDKNNKLKLKAYKKKDSDASLVALKDMRIEFLIWRWLKAFHAALYLSPLPEDSKKTFEIQTPFPSADEIGGNLYVNPIHNNHYEYVGAIKQNRADGAIDFIQANNGKLRYECVWYQLDDGGWGCVFALNLYNWKDLGDVNNFPARGCAGMYRLPDSSVPLKASLSTRRAFTYKNKDKADPFSL